MSIGAARNRGRGRGGKRLAAALLALLLVAGVVGNPSPSGRPPPAVAADHPPADPAPEWTVPPAAEANAAVSDDVLVPGQVVVMLREHEQLDTFLDELIGGDIH